MNQRVATERQGRASGHVHVVAGDITSIVCDAWLLPTDDAFLITRSFAPAIGVAPNTCLDLDWGSERVVRHPDDRLNESGSAT